MRGISRRRRDCSSRWRPSVPVSVSVSREGVPGPEVRREPGAASRPRRPGTRRPRVAGPTGRAGAHRDLARGVLAPGLALLWDPDRHRGPQLLQPPGRGPSGCPSPTRCLPVRATRLPPRGWTASGRSRAALSGAGAGLRGASESAPATGAHRTPAPRGPAAPCSPLLVCAAARAIAPGSRRVLCPGVPVPRVPVPRVRPQSLLAHPGTAPVRGST